MQEKRRINFIYWSFAVSYISYSIVDMGQVIFDQGNGPNIYPGTAHVLDLTMFLAFVYGPIFVVLFTHLRNYSSVRSILKMVWAERKTPLISRQNDTTTEENSSA